MYSFSNRHMERVSVAVCSRQRLLPLCLCGAAAGTEWKCTFSLPYLVFFSPTSSARFPRHTCACLRPRTQLYIFLFSVFSFVAQFFTLAKMRALGWTQRSKRRRSPLSHSCFPLLRYPLASKAHRGVVKGIVGGRALVGALRCDKGVLDSPDNYEMYGILFVWVIYEKGRGRSFLVCLLLEMFSSG